MRMDTFRLLLKETIRVHKDELAGQSVQGSVFEDGFVRGLELALKLTSQKLKDKD